MVGPGGGSRIVDRDGSDNASPKELSSFDVAKMSEAEVAAEIAQRMTRWRRARNRGDRTEPALRADRPAAPSDAAATPAPTTMAPAAGALFNTAGARMERALQRATAVRRRPPAVAESSAESIDVATPPETRTVQAAEHLHAIARLVRQARWPMVAAALLAAGAIAAWTLLPLGRAPPVARQAETPPASPAATPAPDVRAASPVTAAPPAPAPQAPANAPTPVPARIKPGSKLPTLVARLKPDATTKPSPAPAQAARPESAPSAPSPAPPPRSGPQKNSASETAHGTGKDDDLNDLFEQMFSDGLGR